MQGGAGALWAKLCSRQAGEPGGASGGVGKDWHLLLFPDTDFGLLDVKRRCAYPPEGGAAATPNSTLLHAETLCPEFGITALGIPRNPTCTLYLQR